VLEKVAPEKQGKEVLFTQENKCRGRKRKKLNDVEEEKNMKVEGVRREMQKEIRKERNSALPVIIFPGIPKSPEKKL